jgi:RNA polymerase sigma-70 factor (ECF subfamily)
LESSDDRAGRFTELYEHHFDTVRAYAWRRDRELADEIVAETFLLAWRRFDNVPAEPLPWLLGVARNVRLNLRRGERRRGQVEQRAASPPDERDFASSIAERQTVLDALARLGERDREVLRLAAWEDLDTASIGRVLGCTRANVAVRLFRARRRLAAELAKSTGMSPVLREPTTSGGISDVC